MLFNCCDRMHVYSTEGSFKSNKKQTFKRLTHSLHSMRADLTSNFNQIMGFCLLMIHKRLLYMYVEISFASYSFIIKDNIINVYIIRKIVEFTISISMRNPLNCYINIDIYFSTLVYHESPFCISYLKVVILLQYNLKIKLQNYIPDFL